MSGATTSVVLSGRVASLLPLYFAHALRRTPERHTHEGPASIISDKEALVKGVLEAAGESLYHLLLHPDFPPALLSDIQVTLEANKCRQLAVLHQAAARAALLRCQLPQPQP